MKRKSVPCRRTTALKPPLHNMEMGARVATEWALIQFKKVIEDAEAQAQLIIKKAQLLEEKAKRKRRKAKEALDSARHEAAMIVEDAEELADELVSTAMEDAELLRFEAEQEAMNIKANAKEALFVDLTVDEV
jgi:hypothetical protein